MAMYGGARPKVKTEADECCIPMPGFYDQLLHLDGYGYTGELTALWFHHPERFQSQPRCSVDANEDGGALHSAGLSEDAKVFW